MAGNNIRWKRGEMLGQGAFGIVYLGLNVETGELMAVKQMTTEEVSRRELGTTSTPPPPLVLSLYIPMHVYTDNNS